MNIFSAIRRVWLTMKTALVLLVLQLIFQGVDFVGSPPFSLDPLNEKNPIVGSATGINAKVADTLEETGLSEIESYWAGRGLYAVLPIVLSFLGVLGYSELRKSSRVPTEDQTPAKMTEGHRKDREKMIRLSERCKAGVVITKLLIVGARAEQDRQTARTQAMLEAVADPEKLREMKENSVVFNELQSAYNAQTDAETNRALRRPNILALESVAPTVPADEDATVPHEDETQE